jgi:hypothetical protein
MDGRFGACTGKVIITAPFVSFVLVVFTTAFVAPFRGGLLISGTW